MGLARLNQLGLAAYKRSDPLAAVDYLAAAIKDDPTSELILTNYVQVLCELGRSRDAQLLVDQRIASVPNDLRLQALSAKLRAMQGDFDGARKTYAKVFAEGYSDEAALVEYIDLAIKCKAWDEALSVIAEVETRQPTLRVQRWHASLYALKGDFDKSIQMFQLLREQAPDDTGVAIDLADVYQQADKPE